MNGKPVTIYLPPPPLHGSLVPGTSKMGQDLAKIERMYDSIAREYADEFYQEHEKKPMDREVLGRFAREIGDRRPVWDLGCGPGETTRYLNGLGVETWGLDLSERILEEARRNNPGTHFMKGNILDLELETDSAAAVVAFYAIVHFTKEQVEMAFGELFRVLQPGGIALLTYHIGDDTLHINEFLGIRVDIDFMLFTSDFISGCLEERGFENVEILEREPYPAIEYESRRGYAFAGKPVGVDGEEG